MHYKILFYLFFGLYGYFRFAIILWKGKKFFSEGKINTKALARYELLDLIFGLSSLLFTCFIIINSINRIEKSFILISFLYSLSLILRSFRNRLKIAQRTTLYRKIFNYGANLNIVLSAWMLTIVLNFLKIEGEILWVLLLYFGIFIFIWWK